MKTLIAVCLGLATTTAFADSLDEKQYWKRQTNYIDEHLKIAERSCGVKFAFDWTGRETFRSEVTKTKHTPMSVCGNIIDQVASICRDGDEEKKAVAAKIATITCGYAPERALDLKNKTLSYNGNNVQSNFRNWARPWLLKHL